METCGEGQNLAVVLWRCCFGSAGRYGVARLDAAPQLTSSASLAIAENDVVTPSVVGPEPGWPLTFLGLTKNELSYLFCQG